MKDMVLVQCSLCYQLDEEDFYEIGSVKEVVRDDNRLVYVIDIDKSKADKLESLEPNLRYPTGLYLDRGYYQVHVDIPFLIESRIFSRQRDDVSELLSELGLQFYSPVMILGKTEGRSIDKWFFRLIDNEQST